MNGQLFLKRKNNFIIKKHYPLLGDAFLVTYNQILNIFLNLWNIYNIIVTIIKKILI